MPGLMPLNRLLAEIEANPIEGAKTTQKRHDGVRKNNYESSVSAGALYRALKGTSALISAFYDQAFWEGNEDKKAYKKNPANLNKHCHQFVYGARDGSEGKRAEDHASATQDLFDDDDVSLEQVLDDLCSKGGFEGLKQRAAGKGNGGTAAKRVSEDHKKSGAETENPDDDAPPTNDAGDQKPKKTKPRWPRMTLAEVFRHLLITMESDELAQFLPDESEVGDSATIQIIRDKDEKMPIWRAVEISYEPRET